jgi:Zn-dependent peptidase ImmA (M78 family)
LGHLVFKNRLPEGIEEKQEEKLCNAFAAALLLPQEKLKIELGKKRTELNLLELIHIENRYGISVQAIVYRAKDSDIITQYYFETFFKNLNRVYGKKIEFGKFPDIETPTRFNQLLLRGLSEDAFSQSKAAELKNMKQASFRDFLKSELIANTQN